MVREATANQYILVAGASRTADNGSSAYDVPCSPCITVFSSDAGLNDASSLRCRRLSVKFYLRALRAQAKAGCNGVRQATDNLCNDGLQ